MSFYDRELVRLAFDCEPPSKPPFSVAVPSLLVVSLFVVPSLFLSAPLSSQYAPCLKPPPSPLLPLLLLLLLEFDFTLVSTFQISFSRVLAKDRSELTERAQRKAREREREKAITCILIRPVFLRPPPPSPHPAASLGDFPRSTLCPCLCPALDHPSHSEPKKKTQGIAFVYSALPFPLVSPRLAQGEKLRYQSGFAHTRPGE